MIKARLLELCRIQDSITGNNHLDHIDAVRDGQVKRTALIARLVDAYSDMLSRLEDARSAINTLDKDTLGRAIVQRDWEYESWPLRDELLQYIDEAIAKAKNL